MIIDFHVHIYPEALAKRASEKLSETAGITPACEATREGARKKLTESGVTGAVLLNIATKPASVDNVNRFAAESEDAFFYSFGTLHPQNKDYDGGINTIKAYGLKGVKLHPYYQNFVADDPEVFPMYEALEASGLPVIFHAGFDPVFPGKQMAHPASLLKVHRLFPRMTMIAAHMGGSNMAREAADCFAGEDIFIDTSNSSRKMSAEEFASLVGRYDVNRVLYASDTPWSHADREIAYVLSCGLPQASLDRILYKNAAELLKINV